MPEHPAYYLFNWAISRQKEAQTRALYIHNTDDKLPTQPGFEPSNSESSHNRIEWAIEAGHNQRRKVKSGETLSKRYLNAKPARHWGNADPTRDIYRAVFHRVLSYRAHHLILSHGHTEGRVVRVVIVTVVVADDPLHRSTVGLERVEPGGDGKLPEPAARV